MWKEAGTTYESVLRDLTEWWDLVAVGGLVAGREYQGETKRAVDDFAKNAKVIVSATVDLVWYIVKN